MRRLGLITTFCALLTACSDNGGGETGTGPTTGEPTTGAPTTGEPTTGSTTGSSTTGDDPSTSGPTTTQPDPSTGTTTPDPTTTTPDPTTGTTADDSTTEVPETGVVEGTPTLIEDRCAPDDGPALEFKIGVTPLECGADFPEDAPLLTIALWQGGPLAPGVYPLDGGGGFASFDDGNGEKLSMSGTVSVIEWNDGFAIGEIDITFPDATGLVEAFSGIYCPSEPPCK